MGKSKDKVKIELVGKSADGVTGSMYYITYNDKQILLEAGLYQTSGDDILKQYKVNGVVFDEEEKTEERLVVTP